jgi:PAS domain S-box-containing protein
MVDMLESISDGFLSLDEQLVVVYFNKAAEKLLGRRREEVLGRKLFEAFPEAKGSIFEEKYTQGVREKEFLSFETHFGVEPYEDWFNVRVHPQEDGISVYFHIITERKKAEEALRLFTNLTNQANDATFVIDPETSRFLHVNEKAKENLGYTSEELLELGVSDIDAIIPRDFSWPDHVREVADTGSMILEGQHKRKNGTTFPVEVNVRYIVEQERDYMVAVARDITERKRAEEQALQRQAELAHVLRLGTMGEMASGIAHELNQPLAAITSYAGACVRRVDPAGHNGEKLIENLGQIREQAERAGEIIRRLRRLVRKQSPQREAGDIKAIVSEPLSLLHYAARQSSVTMRMDVDDQIPELMVDSVQIQQVILNLCRNSIEAMSEADTQKRELLVRAARLNGAAIEVSVDDTGPGLPDEGGEALFQSFVSTKSNGLGLSISRSIVEAHGGRLWATTDPNGGATFRFTLPIAESEPTHGA